MHRNLVAFLSCLLSLVSVAVSVKETENRSKKQASTELTSIEQTCWTSTKRAPRCGSFRGVFKVKMYVHVDTGKNIASLKYIFFQQA